MDDYLKQLSLAETPGCHFPGKIKFARRPQASYQLTCVRDPPSRSNPFCRFYNLYDEVNLRGGKNGICSNFSNDHYGRTKASSRQLLALSPLIEPYALTVRYLYPPPPVFLTSEGNAHTESIAALLL